MHFIAHLIHARHCSKHLAFISSLTSYNDPKRQVASSENKLRLIVLKQSYSELELESEIKPVQFNSQISMRNHFSILNT